MKNFSLAAKKWTNEGVSQESIFKFMGGEELE